MRVEWSSRFRFMLSCAAVGFLVTGCHRLEKTAIEVIGANLKDPGSLQLRNVHRGRITGNTICGEYNAKNVYGGYVGFKPFAIDAAQQNSLTEIDDDTPQDAKLDYAINCGTEEQRAQAVIAREVEKEEAKKAAAAAVSSPTSAPAETPPESNKAPTPPASSIPNPFDMPTLPTPIENTDCGMGECIWEQITSVSDVIKRGNEVLRKVVTRQTDTETPDGQNYPTTLPPGKHDWTNQTTYYLCSITKPAAAFWDTMGKTWRGSQLNVISPDHADSAAVTDYKRACHGIKAGSNLDQHPDQLGYVDREDAQQYEIKQPFDIMK